MVRPIKCLLGLHKKHLDADYETINLAFGGTMNLVSNMYEYCCECNYRKKLL